MCGVVVSAPSITAMAAGIVIIFRAAKELTIIQVAVLLCSIVATIVPIENALKRLFVDLEIIRRKAVPKALFKPSPIMFTPQSKRQTPPIILISISVAVIVNLLSYFKLDQIFLLIAYKTPAKKSKKIITFQPIRLRASK